MHELGSVLGTGKGRGLGGRTKARLDQTMSTCVTTHHILHYYTNVHMTLVGILSISSVSESVRCLLLEVVGAHNNGGTPYITMARVTLSYKVRGATRS